MANYSEIMMAPNTPWGRYKPSPFKYKVIMLCHKLSEIRMLRQLALWIRRPIKYGSDTPLDIELWGLKLRLYPRGNVSESRFLFTPGLFDRKERLFLQASLRPGCTFLDIGANAGGYSFWVYSLFKDQCRIHAVEPDPELQQKFQFNIESNGAQSIHIAPLALGDDRCRGKLIVNPINKGENYLTASSDQGLKNGIDVPVVPLASFLQSQNIRHVDAMKIDIEGYEFKVLNHFFRHSEKAVWPRLIITEIQDSPEHEKLKQLLAWAGYRNCLRAKMNWIFQLVT
jgi:FkbM family methyltransferase